LRGGFDLRRLAPFVVGGALGVPLGVFLLHNSDPPRFRLAVGALLTLYGFYALTVRDSARLKGGGVGADAFVRRRWRRPWRSFAASPPAPAAIWTRLRGWKRRAAARDDENLCDRPSPS